MHSFRFAFKAKDPRTYHSANWSSSFSATWNDIFYVIAPMMIHEATEPLIRGTLDNFVMERNLERLEGHEDLADKELRAFSLSLEDFQTLKVQLRALGLIVKSEKNGSVKDVGTYWTLTPYGDEVMTRLRAIKRSHEMPVIEADVIEEAGE